MSADPRPEPPGEVTTIWADGNVTRVSAKGYVSARPSVPARPLTPDEIAIRSGREDLTAYYDRPNGYSGD